MLYTMNRLNTNKQLVACGKLQGKCYKKENKEEVKLEIPSFLNKSKLVERYHLTYSYSLFKGFYIRLDYIKPFGNKRIIVNRVIATSESVDELEDNLHSFLVSNMIAGISIKAYTNAYKLFSLLK